FLVNKGGVLLYLNDGKGKFSDATQARLGSTWGSGWAYFIDLGDVDGDGDLDLFAQGGKLSSSALFLNDGKGFFTNLKASRFPANIEGGCERFLDLDGDGDLDLAGSVVLLNDGKGFFKNLPGAFPPSLGGGAGLGRRGRGVAWVDLDGDGDTDILGLQTTHTGPFIFFNLRRHLQAPFLPTMGRPYELRFFGGPGKAVLPLLSRKGSRVDLGPLGIFRLGAAGTAPLPPVWFTPSGTARLFLPIPKVPALLNATFYAQGLVLEPGSPAGARLTNALKETVLGI
ncbi:MAG TPA: VCBS repeat-containing protein, partial [Planctomycetes bacterium]|nr:VCBS repeat-containing protein [Planctomycetota bacterium]